ncbi:tyrosine-type recombinase/integrase [Streptomyces siamensis]|uniref:Tyr recombinase domain-containing protein n=1 Tax=Streptomyces siamensis TaxID=1274986 RepID=A0ABP9JGB5_9ACTN
MFRGRLLLFFKGEVLDRDAVCLLDVPTHKTGTAFTKPVDPLLGKAVEAWQAVRPAQPQMLDHKTGELANFLFAHRARRVAKHYINTTITPMLCRKAGVPTADVRGNITSHRARSTIASQLYNAKEPMTPFELQEWLGHRTPEATAHYAKITPKSSSTATRSPPAPPPAVSPGSTTTWATACAPTPSPCRDKTLFRHLFLNWQVGATGSGKIHLWLNIQ